MLTLCLDIGGTKIAAGLADPDGALVHTAIRPHPGTAAPPNRSGPWSPR